MKYYYNYETETAKTETDLLNEYNELEKTCLTDLHENYIFNFNDYIETLSAMGGEMFKISETEYNLYKDLEMYENEIKSLKTYIKVLENKILSLGGKI